MPECCGQKMEEVVAEVGIDEERDEVYEDLVGYKCTVCNLEIDINGKEIG